MLRQLLVKLPAFVGATLSNLKLLSLPSALKQSITAYIDTAYETNDESFDEAGVDL